MYPPRMRRYSDRPLPAQAYIPGRSARPELRAGAPEITATPADGWLENSDYLYGVDLYNHGYVWEAHEVWEGLWRADDDPLQRSFLQGLIQCAATAVKAEQGRGSGAAELGRRGRGHLGKVIEAAGRLYMGLDVAAFAGAFASFAAEEPSSAVGRPLIELTARSRDRLGTRSDFLAQAPSTEYTDRGNYLLARTPSHPPTTRAFN